MQYFNFQNHGLHNITSWDCTYKYHLKKLTNTQKFIMTDSTRKMMMTLPRILLAGQLATFTQEHGVKILTFI